MPGEEQTYNWKDLKDYQQNIVVEVHAIGLKANADIIRRIFDLAKPVIIVADDWSYCRIHQDSAQLVKNLIKEYL